jgi:hypothetical protein
MTRRVDLHRARGASVDDHAFFSSAPRSPPLETNAEGLDEFAVGHAGSDGTVGGATDPAGAARFSPKWDFRA